MPALTYYGHSAIRLDDGRCTLFIDPFLTHNPVSPVKAEAIDKCDYILLTHGHADHVGDTLALARRFSATVIGTHELASFLGSKGVKVHTLAVGGGHDFPFGRVDATLAFHGVGADPLEDGSVPPANMPVGYVVTIGGKKIYHAGDTALFSDLQLVSRRGPIALACLPIGDNFTMDVADAVQAARWIDAACYLPMHYNTFEVIRADAQQFAQQLRQFGKSCTVLKPGERLEV